LNSRESKYNGNFCTIIINLKNVSGPKVRFYSNFISLPKARFEGILINIHQFIVKIMKVSEQIFEKKFIYPCIFAMIVFLDRDNFSTTVTGFH
jgi:hypothetical protein